MNKIYQKRLEGAAKKNVSAWIKAADYDTVKAKYIKGGEYILANLWISVEDGLPEVGDRPFSKRVLILCKNGAVTRACYIKQTNSWFCVDAGFGVGNTDVTHWMPFPEPKKGGEK